MSASQTSQGHSNIQVVGDNAKITVGTKTNGVDKLWEVVGNYLQGICSAKDLVRLASATEKAKTIATKEQIKREKLLRASTHGIAPFTSADIELLQIVLDRERRHQNNIAKIVQFAETSLADSEVEEQMPEAEWVDQFFEYCQSISSEQMQRLWGCILSQKIKSPKIGKPLTLHCMKMLGHANAKVFEELCNMALVAHDKIFVLRDLVEHFEYGDLLELENIGLINAAKDIWFYTRTDRDRFLRHYEVVIELTEISKERDSHIAIVPFTASGIELFGLIGQRRKNTDCYLQRMVNIFNGHHVFASAR